jgi:hypothetical protein
LSIADKNLIKLIKSYFNFYFSKKILTNKRMTNRFKRLAVNKIFISKAELKHTNSKVVITLYVYNEEKRILVRKIKRLETILFPFLTTSTNNKYLSIEEKLNIIKNQENSISFIK